MSFDYGMNLHLLRHFVYVAEEGSVTRGAERAAVSQPAISRGLAELEASCGARLFDRGPKGVILTEEGRTLLAYAQRIFALERQATEELANLRGLEGGRLAIGASTTIGDYLLPGAVARFLTLHPAVELTVEVANTEVVQRHLAEGRFDVGFTEGMVEPGQFETRVLTQDRLAVVAAREHPLAGRSVGLEELAGASFVMREAGSGTRRIVEKAFAQAGIQPQTVCALGSTESVKRAVARGLGLGVVSVLTIQDELARGVLVEVETPLVLTRDLHTIRVGWRSESPALRRFLGLLKEEVGGGSAENGRNE